MDIRSAGRARSVLLLGIPALLLVAGACAFHSENRRKVAEGHYKEAKAYLDQGRGIEDEMNRRRAYAPIRKAVEMDPDQPDYHNVLGAIYLKDLRFEDARREFGTALELDPQNAMAHQNLGQLYLATGRPEEALREFDTTLSDYSYQTPWIAHFNKGRAYFDLRKYSAAVQAFQAAVAVAPQWGAAWESLGRALEEDNRLGDSEKAFLKALELMPTSVVSTYHLGLVYYRGKKTPEALDQFRRTVVLDPDGDLGRNAAKYLSILK